MRFLLSTALMISGLFAQDRTELRAPDWGWINQAQKFQSDAAAEQRSAVGRVRPVTGIHEEAFQFFSSDERERVLLFTLDNDSAALRLHFENFRLPQGGQLFVYGLDANNQVTRIAGPYRASGPLNSGEFWSKAVPGVRIAVELQLDEEIATLPFSLREVAHLDGIEEREEILDTGKEIERRVSVYRGMIVEHAVVDGVGIWEGDVLLGRAEELEAYRGDKKQTERMATAINGSSYRWTGGIVPYTIDASMTSPQKVLDAIAHWNTLLAGYIQIKPRTSESAYITFVNPAGSPGTCSSYIGKIGIAGQPVNLGDYCSTGNAIHEIGHALGLYHEHTRSDRATYIKVNTANIDPNSAYNFNMATTGILASAYDYNSIMHYGAYAFSINGLPTIETIPAGIAIGQRNGLSTMDIAGIKSMYPATTAPAPPPPTTTTISVTFNSSPQGLALTVDGANVVTPATVSWTSGTSHTISAPNVSGSTSYTFSSWSDGGTQTHSVSAGTSAMSFTANYVKRNKLTLSSNSSLGTVSVSPASADGYYADGTVVTVSASASSTACFTGWSGILPVASFSTQLTMTQPYTVTANFQTGGLTLTSMVLVSAASQTSQGSVSITGGCIWKAVTSGSWISLQTPTGTSSSLVKFNVNQNTSGYSRTGLIYVNGKAMWVAQASK